MYLAIVLEKWRNHMHGYQMFTNVLLLLLIGCDIINAAKIWEDVKL